MTYPFLACLLLAGIHVYLGIHVIERQVIFVDLALAQVAAFGAVYGVLLGYDLHGDSLAIKVFSLAFAVFGAWILSATRMRRTAVPHEAIIGIVYAAALAATILASVHLPHGAEEVSQLLAGSILWVDRATILSAAVVYSLVGVFHLVFRRQLLLISTDPQAAEQQGLSLRRWDFLFYLSFGVVVTSSVAIAGVLLVFSYLVIPAVIAMMFARGIRPRLWIGWSLGAVFSLVGVSVSYQADLPSGPTIVVCFAAALVFASIIHTVRVASNRLRALRRVALGTALLITLAASSWMLRNDEGHDFEELIASPVKNARLMGLSQARDPATWQELAPFRVRLFQDEEPEVRSLLVDLVQFHHAGDQEAAVAALLFDPDDHVRERAVRCLLHLQASGSAPALLRAAQQEADDFLKAEFAHALLELGDARGFEALLDVLETSSLPQARKDAYEFFQAHCPLDHGFRSDLLPADPGSGIQAMRNWFEEHRYDLVLDSTTGAYHPED
jgi:zinc/manganese transport system permease protein